MIRFATPLMAVLAVAMLAGTVKADPIELDTDSFKYVDTSYKWMTKYGGMLTDGQQNKLDKWDDEKSDKWLEKFEAKTAKKLEKWEDKMMNKKPVFDHTASGLYVKKAKGANFYVNDTPLVDVKYTAGFSVEQKKANGSVGFVFGMTGACTEDVSYYMLQWHNNKVKTGVELLKVDGLGNGSRNLKKADLISGGDNVTVLDSADIGGYATDGSVNEVMITYLADSIEIMVGGETLSAAGSFEAGAFGYYVFGQNGVTFNPFPPTVEDLSGMPAAEFAALVAGEDAPDIQVASVPTPAALPAGLGMLMLAASRRKRRAA